MKNVQNILKNVTTFRNSQILGVAVALIAGLAAVSTPVANAETTTNNEVTSIAGGAVAGSAPVGSTSYPIPSDAVFVKANGSNTGTGSLNDPYGSLGFAISKAKVGSTLVLRAGNYHESVKIPHAKSPLHIQSYPKEEVWLDGSSVVTGWRRETAVWSVPWTLNFDAKVFSSEGIDESSRWLSPDNLMGGHPDQVWINGAKQTQVGTKAEVKPGKFFVDKTAKKMFIGTNPVGRKVQASTLQQGLVIWGTGSVIRGIGARNYGNTYWMGGAISAQVNDIVIENVVSTRNATIGLNGWGKNMSFNQVTVTESGALGIGLNRADNFKLSNSRVENNNQERFKSEPESGGMKVCRGRNISITDSVFIGNLTTGLWFDVFTEDTVITGNTFTRNGKHGLELEMHSRSIVADNYFIENESAGLFIIASNSIDVWNNTFSGNKQYSVRMFQDNRRDSESPSNLLVKDISMFNNVFAFGNSSCQYLTDDYLNVNVGNDMVKAANGNAFHRVNATSPANMACWEGASAGIKSYKTLGAFSAATGHDKQSMMFEGSSILTTAYKLTPAALNSTKAVPLPIRADVASKIGVTANSRILGAVSPIG